MAASEKNAEEVEDFLNQTSPEKTDKQVRNEMDFGDDEDQQSVCGKADLFKCCPTKQQVNDATFCNRMVMASVAVVMLWTSSLSVALSIVQYAIPAPSSDAVYSVCSYAYDVSANERSAYIACADRQLDSCNDAFTESIEETLGTVLENFEFNTALLETSRTTQTRCAGASTNAQAALGVWQEGGTEQVIEYDLSKCADPSDLATCPVDCSLDAHDRSKRNSSCTCADVARRVNDIGSARTEAYGQATGYASYSGDVVGSLAAYSEARANYDAEYIKNKTSVARVRLYEALQAAALPHVEGMNASFVGLVPNVQNVIACTSVGDSDSTCGSVGIQSAAERFAEVMAMLASQLQEAREAFSEFADDAALYSQRVADALRNMVDFYEGFKQWAQDVFLDTDDLPWFDLGIEDLIVPDPNLPSGLGITSYIPPIPGAEDMWAEVEPLYEQYLASLTLASRHTRDLAADWAQQVALLAQHFPAFYPNDYDPPKYEAYNEEENATATRKKHGSESEKFKARQAASLNAFADIESYDDDNSGSTFSGYNFSIGDDALNFAGGLYFPFEPLRGSNVNFNVWMLSVGDLTSFLVLFDYLYRAYQSLQIFARFYGRSGVMIPDADMQVDRKEFQVGSSPVQAAMELATSPYVLGLVAALFGAVFVVYFCAVYIPLLESYKGGCVTGDTSNGTFVSNNLYSVSYNYAASDGNEDLFNGLSDYNVAKADYCSAYATSTAEQQQEDELFLSSLRAAQKASRDDVNLFKQCVDSSAMDESFQRACCGQQPNGGKYDACSAYGSDDLWTNSSLACPLNEYDRPSNSPFAPLSEYLSDPACELPKDSAWDEWELKDAVFRCGDVPDCTTTCSGPSQALLRTVSEQCGCSAEWLFHASWLRTSIGTCIYLLMNASRVMFVGALCKLFWRYLSPGIFTYVATCDHHGNVLAPRDTEKYDSFTGPTGSLKKELNRTLLEFVGTAWATIVGAAGLNALWLYFVVSASEDLRYDPSAQH
mmetsp:Transcript_29098/g.59526  ORF Transcript_29098/g.59526 Transcript_29098/m.59526 type:complete len:999 (-) Transcript_29098:133-3129(-)